MSDKATKIKALAMEGNFAAILQDYGSKAAEKAHAYVNVKLAKLRDGGSTNSDAAISPFIAFALTLDAGTETQAILASYLEVVGKAGQSNCAKHESIIADESTTIFTVVNNPEKPSIDTNSTSILESCIDIPPVQNEFDTTMHISKELKNTSATVKVGALKKTFCVPQATRDDGLLCPSDSNNNSLKMFPNAIKAVQAMKPVQKKVKQNLPLSDQKKSNPTNRVKQLSTNDSSKSDAAASSRKRKAAISAAAGISDVYVFEAHSHPDGAEKKKGNGRVLSGDFTDNSNANSTSSSPSDDEKEEDNYEEDHRDGDSDEENSQCVVAPRKKTISRKEKAFKGKAISVSKSSGSSRKPTARKQVPPTGIAKGKATTAQSAHQGLRGPKAPPKSVPQSQRGLGDTGIVKLKGIKQKDLPADQDLLHASMMPNETEDFPKDFIPVVGEELVLVMEPYRDFISKLPTNMLSAHDMQQIEGICCIHRSAIVCRVKQIDEFAVPRQVRGTAYTVVISVDDDEYEILYAPFSSALLSTDKFLLHREEFKQSLRVPWLVRSAQVRRAFAIPDGSGIEWIEGNIYHIRDDVAKIPYNAISVVWVERECDTFDWVYKYDQMDNLCSPWDVKLSRFVLPQKVKAPTLPRALVVGQLSAASVIDYLKSLDFASVFKYKLSANAEFCSMFPNKGDQLDLHAVSSLCAQGRYDANDAIGLTALFRDLELMVLNGKKFNEMNRGFQVWRLIDMLEKTIADMKCELITRRGNTLHNLKECTQDDAAVMEELLSSQMEPEEI